jgi:asparagine synthase (glutamine-hydrolysing)
MCGFVGFSGEFQSALMRKALELLAHRGPDDQGLFERTEHAIALGHTRLSIIDLSSLGRQPMVSTDGQVVIAYNGEVFNYRELRSALENKGHVFLGHSDTEVLLHLYLEEGESMLGRLNGMFAFALWDRRKDATLLVRDEMGVKPLYWAHATGGMAFGSELKSLMVFPGVDSQLDMCAVRDHLTYLWATAPRTLFQGVRKLEPGYAMWIRAGEIKRHWRWADIDAAQPIIDRSDTEAVNSVRDAVRTAVHRQMVADVPVGAFLSGGLDSSAVAAFAREVESKSRLQCFTIAMDSADAQREGFADDLPYARRVARHLDVDLHVVRATEGMADDLLRMVWQLDEPQADPAPLNVLAISSLARRHGIKVLLSGAGGDDIFTGYRRHYAIQAEQHLRGMPSSVRSAVASMARKLPARNVFSRRLRKGLGEFDLTGDARIASYFRWTEEAWVDSLLTPAVRAASRRPDPLVATLSELPESVPALNRMLHLECRHFLADHNLNYTDKMSMAAGIEVRVPLLDRDLVKLAFSLPLRSKQRGKQGKWALMEAMRGILPDEILSRPKTGFGAPLRTWLHGPLRHLLHDTLGPSALRRRGIFDPEGVSRLIKADAEGHVDGAYTLFSIMCIELWCRAFVDGHASFIASR